MIMWIAPIISFFWVGGYGLGLFDASVVCVHHALSLLTNILVVEFSSHICSDTVFLHANAIDFKTLPVLLVMDSGLCFCCR